MFDEGMKLIFIIILKSGHGLEDTEQMLLLREMCLLDTGLKLKY